MKIYKKVVLDKNEIAIIKASLLLRGESYRSWIKKCTGRDSKSTAEMSNIMCNGVVSYTVYEKVLKDLDLPFFRNFKWVEDKPTRSKII